MSMIRVENLTFAYPGSYDNVFENVSFQFDTGWKLGFLGRNGRGKTTFLRLLLGEYPCGGGISGAPPCAYFPREPGDPSRMTLEVLQEAAPTAEEWELLRETGLLGVEAEALYRPFSTLSNGERTKALLAALFCGEERYLLIDEPTNHLDARGRRAAAAYLRRKRGFLLVSHDRAFLDGCVDHILALNPSGPELVRGSFSSWLRDKEDRDRGELARNEKLKGDIRRLEQAAIDRKRKADAVERAKVGISQDGIVKHGLRPYLGEKSRKGQQQRKNIERRAERAIQEKAGLLKDIERADSLKLTPLAHFSQRLLEGRELAVSYPGMAGRPISFTVCQGDRLCLEGGNGSGKTSLLRLALGEEVPHTGTLLRASGLEISYVPQKADHLRGGPVDWAEEQGIEITRFLTILRKLGFSRALFERDMGEYSAGQQKKVLLAASLCQSAHLYVWDEPLNYIDLFSRMQIEELLLQYRPTLLFVEHDRVFREKIATQVVCMSAPR